MSETMKAAVVEADGSLVIRELPMPRIGEYQALVKLCWGATCAGTDQRVMDGGHPNPIAFPAILGHESVGRVVETGPKAVHFREGDLISRVGAPAYPELGVGLCWGGFAQYGVATDWQAMQKDGIPQSQWASYRVQQVIPADIPERAAPMFITWRETLSYINRMGVGKGDRVLVTGSGANSLAFLHHCVHAGATVAVVGSASRIPQVLACGAAAGMDYRAPDLLDQLRAAFPDGIHHIVDGVGVPDNVNLALPLLAEHGLIGVYGWHERGSYGIQPFAAAHSFRVYCGGYQEWETHRQVVDRVRAGALRAEEWYDMDRPVPLDKLSQAYRDLLDRKALKYLIDLS